MAQSTYSDFYESDNYRACISRDVDWDEYVIRLYKKGERQEVATYHTDDGEDAHGTAKLMLVEAETKQPVKLETVSFEDLPF